MKIMGTKRAIVGESDLLKPLVVEGRPQAFPGSSGLAVIFGYDKIFFENRQEEALVLCESIKDMQACHDRLHGKTRTAWYTAEVPDPLEYALVPVIDQPDIEEDFEGLL